jgi:hypothetical protein
VAFEPRFPDRLESLLLDQGEDAGVVPLEAGAVARHTMEMPASAWLSSIDVGVQEWARGLELRLALRDASGGRRRLGEAGRASPSEGPVARFVFIPPLALRGGSRVGVELTGVGSPGAVMRLRGTADRLRLQAFAAEPGVTPLAMLPAGTVFLTMRAGTLP